MAKPDSKGGLTVQPSAFSIPPWVNGNENES